MTALIIEWDPEGPEWNGAYASGVETVRRTGLVRQHWFVPSGTVVTDGMEAWLIVIGRHAAMQGLIGHGTVARTTSDPMSGPVVDPPGDAPVRRVDLDLDSLLPHGDQVPLEQLLARLPGLVAAGFRALTVDASVERVLRSLWTEAGTPEPGSLEPGPGALPHAAVRRVLVNRFERDPDLRRVAVAHRGSACHACGMDFEQMYGADAADLIQVHHITPVERIDAAYEVDPIVDLIPLCPNCHVAIHSRWPDPYSVEELRTILRRSGFLRGTVLSDEQLESEAAAARILRA